MCQTLAEDGAWLQAIAEAVQCAVLAKEEDKSTERHQILAANPLEIMLDSSHAGETLEVVMADLWRQVCYPKAMWQTARVRKAQAAMLASWKLYQQSY